MGVHCLRGGIAAQNKAKIEKAGGAAL